jgi:glycosyltransferase involved in cell wall biosynthesis
MNILKPVLSEHPDWFEKTNILYDAEALFVTRDIAFRKLIGAPMPEKKVDAITREEIALAAAADVVISVSDSDRRVFEKYGIERVHVLGHSIHPAATPKPFSKRTGFLFVGAIHHESSPNGDSMIWFLKEVFPKIRSQLGESIPFTIAGVAGSERVHELAGPGVRITGPLSDLTELYDSSRVFVAPTRYAAGIPHKVHEAAAYGVPTVTTTLIAEQLGWKSGEELLAADAEDPVGFAQQCIRLFQSQELWERLRENALVRIQRDCSEEQFARTLRQALKPCWSKDKPNLEIEDNPDRGVRVSGTRM